MNPKNKVLLLFVQNFPKKKEVPYMDISCDNDQKGNEDLFMEISQDNYHEGYVYK